VNDLNSMDKPLRLQVFLAKCGIASRRASESLIASGRVTVNDVSVVEMGSKVSVGDRVAVDGKAIRLESRFRYILLHKPPGYICSSKDPQGRPLAIDLLPADITERVYTVGRLDYQSSGLIIFTNDGDFAAKISHPSAEIEKEYIVESTVPIPDSMIAAFGKGVQVEDTVYTCVSVKRIGRFSVQVILIEGKNREIRRVFSHFHLHASKLHRVRIGRLNLGNLAEGRCRNLEEPEIAQLYASIQRDT
jgi:23S rRNA pseudouridine2605 synthase